ncbi:hypothetical protein FIBSPDRAFT_924771 [Athelia psychrophila]|uniref:Uncharacterized protein n=1 Tax=Athelia psychrophila TaxID=1759441 RepID=A0A166W0J3_9AGAM|nr:hypothetical protein FIBSPDRAFT_924771 [Fibularhizoctonia sp. CBS 109695]
MAFNRASLRGVDRERSHESTNVSVRSKGQVGSARGAGPNISRKLSQSALARENSVIAGNARNKDIQHREEMADRWTCIASVNDGAELGGRHGSQQRLGMPHVNFPPPDVQRAQGRQGDHYSRTPSMEDISINDKVVMIWRIPRSVSGLILLKSLWICNRIGKAPLLVAYAKAMAIRPGSRLLITSMNRSVQSKGVRNAILRNRRLTLLSLNSSGALVLLHVISKIEEIISLGSVNAMMDVSRSCGSGSRGECTPQS